MKGIQCEKSECGFFDQKEVFKHDNNIYLAVCRNRAATCYKNDIQGVTLALRGLWKGAGGEKLEEAEGLRADC